MHVYVCVMPNKSIKKEKAQNLTFFDGILRYFLCTRCQIRDEGVSPFKDSFFRLFYFHTLFMRTQVGLQRIMYMRSVNDFDESREDI